MSCPSCKQPTLQPHCRATGKTGKKPASRHPTCTWQICSNCRAMFDFRRMIGVCRTSENTYETVRLHKPRPR